jgi:hypothetical protein
VRQEAKMAAASSVPSQVPSLIASESCLMRDQMRNQMKSLIVDRLISDLANIVIEYYPRQSWIKMGTSSQTGRKSSIFRHSCEIDDCPDHKFVIVQDGPKRIKMPVVNWKKSSNWKGWCAHVESAELISRKEGLEIIISKNGVFKYCFRYFGLQKDRHLKSLMKWYQSKVDRKPS